MTTGKLTTSERARLGGLTAAHRLGENGVKRRGRKGGNATLERHGKAHFYKAALIRWGKLPGKESGGE
jgi:hypothetical protein